MPPIIKPVEHFRRPFCPKMHYKPETGVNTENRCYLCAIEKQRTASREYRRRKRTLKAPQYQDATKFREVRERLGLGAYAFAAEIGVSYQTVYEWERGKKRIKAETVERIIPTIARLLREHNQRILREQDERAKKERHTGDKRRYSMANRRAA